MMSTGAERAARFSLITLAQRFLLTALPLRERESAAALRGFVASLASIQRVPTAVLDAVLVRVLRIIDQHTGARAPTLLERYVATSSFSQPACLCAFTACIDELLRYRGVGHRAVQHAVTIIDQRYGDPALSLTTLADDVGKRPSTLCGLFKATTGTTIHQYLRNIRLERAVEMLATTNKSVKEVWSAVGYSHASDFNHHFKLRFGMSPREYQLRATRVVSSAAIGDRSPLASPPPRSRHTGHGTPASVLLVDDDDGTRGLVTQHLNDSGYRVYASESMTAALAHARQMSPDLILLDFHQPDLNAIELLRTMREEVEDSRPPVIVFSADWDVEDQANDLVRMNAVFVPKPCDLDNLGDMVRSCLRHEPAAGQARQAMLLAVAMLMVI